MDGTLTHAIHDFDDIRQQLGLPEGKPILESIAELPNDEAIRISEQLDAIEYQIAYKATAQPHCVELLTLLQKNQYQLGIVTRNGHGIAKATLQASGIDQFFTDEHIISRDCCAPKPAPDGVTLLLSRMNAEANNAVMIGDYLFDIEAGKKAGTKTVHLDVQGNFPWPTKMDYGVLSLDPLAALWR